MASPESTMSRGAGASADSPQSAHRSDPSGLPAVRKRVRPSVPPASAAVVPRSEETMAGEPKTVRAPDAPVRTKDYEVGYRRPPAHGRFQKGRAKTGGRKKSVRNIVTIVKECLDEKHRIVRDGKPIKTTTRDIIVAQIVKKAANGDLKAANWLLCLAGDGPGADAITVNSGQETRRSVSAAESDMLRDHLQRQCTAAGLTSEQIETVLIAMGLGLGTEVPG